MKERGGQLKHTMTQDLWFRNSSPSGLPCPARETLRALEAPGPSVGQSRPRWTVPTQPLWRARWQALPRPGGALLVVGPPGLRHSIQLRLWQAAHARSAPPAADCPAEDRSGRMLAVADSGWLSHGVGGGGRLSAVSNQLHHCIHNLRRKGKEPEQRPVPSSPPCCVLAS